MYNRPTAAESRRQPKMIQAAAVEQFMGRRRESAAIENRRRRTICGSLVFYR